MYIGYVDQSGDQTFITHTAVLIPADRWVSCWNIWMNWRRTLLRKYGIPESFELHCSPFLHGNLEPLPRFELRGTMVDAAINTSAGLQRQVIQDSLREIGSFPSAKILTVAQPGTDRIASYEQLLGELDNFLTAERSQVFLAVDGPNAGHRACHGRLPRRQRRVIEEPWMRESHEAQFVQVADLAAHLACHAVRRDNGDHGSWDWYGLFLTERLVWSPGTADGIFWP